MADNAAVIFNGKNLDGWTGNEQLWSVQNGEIVGTTQGLKKNEFLVSDFLTRDFKLSLEVKLINNQGNSGIQFRSKAIGSRIRTWINGHPCVDLDDDKGAREGIIALQLHSGGTTEVRFRNLQLEVK